MTRTHIRIITTAILALISVACSSPGNVVGGRGQTLTVGSSASADYASIQSAVVAARSGSTITIEPGTYIEFVYISKSLTLIGAGAATMIEYPPSGVSDAAVLEIRDTSNVRIESLAVRSTPAFIDGIRVRSSTGIVLRSVVASNNSGDGIDIRGSLGVDVIESNIESNGDDGLQVDELSGNIRIISCRAASNQFDGIKFRNSSDGLIQNNTTTLNRDDGILVRTASGVRVIDNSSSANIGTGIKVINSPDTVIQNNAVSGNGSGNVICEPPPCP